ncbi:MAG: excinuclease ABC subunit UvrA, partial [Deltaproteobacteria bacterium]|nr:excinuclease ABC subunit UvrA [Deltaproteobacteria bacterium]
TYKMHVRVFLSRYRSYDICATCDGTRFKQEPLLYRIGERTIAQVYALNVRSAATFFNEVKISQTDEATGMVLAEVKNHLQCLLDLGVGYLTLDRQSRTLSGGEVQRVALASSLGASLVNTLYVLDEPSIGLHPRDSHRLVRILQKLRDLSNTVVVVEHDPEIIKQTDYLLDLGPEAGEKGGEVIYFGPTRQVKQSLTGQYLRGKRRIAVPESRRSPKKGRFLAIRNAKENNLKGITARIPLGLFVCLTGVSGSGKSTLAQDILYKAVKRGKNDPQGKPGRHGSLAGLIKIDDAVMVDQHPIGRTSRANLLTYTKAMDSVRKLFAATPEARKRELGPGFFSFNVPGGRCETCRGDGYERVEMQFLSDVFVPCPDCNGRRFKSETLAIRYAGKDIGDILELTVQEALVFFHDQAAIVSALLPADSVGLGYMRLGQPLNTLSGGEAQRLKLSKHLKEAASSNCLFIFDEPTTGLHPADIEVLLRALTRLVDRGDTVLVIEHNMDVIKTADWVIDLGPEGGDDGGQIVVEGTPETVAAHGTSYTGQFLKKALGNKTIFTNRRKSRTGICESEEAMLPAIGIQGDREHNLKNIDLSIPRSHLVVVTGVSGSGKSTLAFDILFAEGQRRYLESLTPYVRQYVGVLERPDVDFVTGLPPSVAIEQRISHAGRRSTVATLTEVYHFLRLMFAKLGTPHCMACERPLETQSRASLVDAIGLRHSASNAMILAPQVYGRKGYHKDLLAGAFKKGIRRARIDGKIVTLKNGMSLSRYHPHNIEFVMGRLSGRLSDPDPGGVIDAALNTARGVVLVLNKKGEEAFYSLHGICPACGIGVEPADPKLFSFNSPQGACPKCNGLGRKEQDGASGIIPCSECGGSRLRKEALAIRIKQHTLWDLVRMAAGDLLPLVKNWSFPRHQAPIFHPLITEITTRLLFLVRLGLGYLSLDRAGDTLSGGEAQRVRLAAQLGSNLTGALYVLDEPTIGLHPRDNDLLLSALRTLRDRGNTVLVVEHDEETIRSADLVIDLGPGGGQHGGEVVAMGKPSEIKQVKRSTTAAWIDAQPHGNGSRLRNYKRAPKVTVSGASANNLKKIDVEFPLGVLMAVTGVSGSGKSTLVKHTLFQVVQNKLLNRTDPAGRYRKMKGWEQIGRILEVDHSPIGKTPRSVPASYVGFLTDIRNLFSQVPEARVKGFEPGRFSFNVVGGRCENCKGQGRPKVAMSFLPDVYVPCDVCGGARFNTETLSVRYRGLTIAQVLELTFDEASDFFSAVPTIRRAMELICEIGLGYLKLGQPSPTLSGGEAQRIKLARQLVKSNNGHTVYVLDEPTTGLHPDDVQRLVGVLQKLVDRGNTVIAVEHNMSFVLATDYIIDLGPEGGFKGGKIVATGSPKELVDSSNQSPTIGSLRKWAHLKRSSC